MSRAKNLDWLGMTNKVSAASPPALAKDASTGHPLFRSGKVKTGAGPLAQYSGYIRSVLMIGEVVDDGLVCLG